MHVAIYARDVTEWTPLLAVLRVCVRISIEIPNAKMAMQSRTVGPNRGQVLPETTCLAFLMAFQFALKRYANRSSGNTREVWRNWQLSSAIRLDRFVSTVSMTLHRCISDSHHLARQPCSGERVCAYSAAQSLNAACWHSEFIFRWASCKLPSDFTDLAACVHACR
jgi:hypothetical protein